MSQIEPYVIPSNATLRDAIKCIDKNSKGIAFVVDADLHLLGSVSDGDIRRAILNGVSLGVTVQVMLDERRLAGGHGPITAKAEDSAADLLRLMNEHEIRQVPVLDSEGHILRVAFLGDLVRDYELPINAVVMAGGFGTRLRPLTDNTPKPMLPIGDRPILEWTIEQLKKTGIHHISLTTHYKPEAISGHFGNGDDFGVEIDYVHEETPLGTAGALGLLGKVDGPLLVMNGDILTHVDFRTMLDYHRAHKACLTVGVRQYELQVPYGVLECSGAKVCKVSEKPQLNFLVNAGIYLIEPEALEYIPRGRNFDMPDLIQSLIGDKRTVVSFPILEYWLDVGRPADYATAQEDVRSGRIS
jgi:dTDP-glucose pyrophosphorylase/CBS domain-containing protein